MALDQAMGFAGANRKLARVLLIRASPPKTPFKATELFMPPSGSFGGRRPVPTGYVARVVRSPLYNLRGHSQPIGLG